LEYHNTTKDPIASVGYTVNGVPISRRVYNSAYLRPCIDRLELNGKSRYLEIGFGSGLMLRKIEKIVGESTGIDISQELCEKNYTGTSRVYNVSVINMKFKEGSFDRMLMYSVAMFFPSIHYLKRVIRICLNCLSTGGILLVGDVLIKNKKYKSRISNMISMNLWTCWTIFGYPYSIMVQPKCKRLINDREDIIIYKE